MSVVIAGEEWFGLLHYAMDVFPLPGSELSIYMADCLWLETFADRIGRGTRSLPVCRRAGPRNTFNLYVRLARHISSGGDRLLSRSSVCADTFALSTPVNFRHVTRCSHRTSKREQCSAAGSRMWPKMWC